MLKARGLDVDLAQLRAGGGRETPRAREGALGGSEAGKGGSEDPRAREAQQVEGPRRDEQGQGRVEPAREAQDHPAKAGVLEPACEPRGLDGEDVLAALVEGGGIARHEGMGVDGAHQAMGMGRRDRRQLDAAVFGAQGIHGIGERVLPQALDREPLRVDVAEHEVALALEPLAFGEKDAVLRDDQMAVEDDVGGRLVDSGVGVDVGGEGAAGLLAHQLAAIVGLGHEVVGRGQVQEDGGAFDRVVARRRDGGPEVFTDLDREHHPGRVRHPEEERRAEGSGLAGESRLVGHRVPGRREPAFFVVLLVVRQEGLGHEAEQAARLADGGDVEQPAVQGHGQAEGENRSQVRSLAQHAAEGRLGASNQGAQAEEKVTGGVSRQRKLGEDHDLGPGTRGLARQAHDLGRVRFGVGHHHTGTGRRDAQEPMRRAGHG